MLIEGHLKTVKNDKAVSSRQKDSCNGHSLLCWVCLCVHMRVHACMHVCACVCASVCICVCAYVCRTLSTQLLLNTMLLHHKVAVMHDWKQHPPPTRAPPSAACWPRPDGSCGLTVRRLSRLPACLALEARSSRAESLTSCRFYPRKKRGVATGTCSLCV